MSKEARAMSPQASQVVDHLRPQLAALERERQALSDRTRRLLIIIGVTSLLAAVLLRLILGSDWGGMAILALIAGAVVAVWQLMVRQKQWEQRVLDAAIPVICESLGEIAYQATTSANDFVPAFEKLGVVGTSSRRELRHYFRGKYDGTGFEFADAMLRSGSSSKNSGGSTAVFQGLLFRIQLPYSVDQRLLISPRVSIKLLNKRADMSEVLLADPAFDEKFVVHHELNHPDGAALAARIITPEFRQGLLELNQQEGNKAFGMGAFVIGLMYDSLYIAKSGYQKTSAIGKIQIESPIPFLDVRFFMRSKSKLEERVGRMVEDVATVYRVIDKLPLAA